MSFERTEEYKQKMREAILASPAHKASLARLHESNKGRKHSEETKQKMRKKGKGRVFTEEHCLNISKAKSTPEAIAHNIEVHTGRKRSKESRRNMSVAAQASPKTAIKLAKLREFNTGKHANLGIPKSDAHKQAMRGIPKSEAAKRKLSLAKLGKPSKNKGVPMKEEHRQNLRQSPKFRAHLLSLSQYKGPTSLELFIEHCLTSHEWHPFEREAEIPGFSDLQGCCKPWDFLLPDKKIALELDGTHWHQPRPERNFAWDCNKEAFFELYAALLGWKVIRIPEKVLRQSKPYRQWLRERNSERKAIKRACKPPRMRFNFATKAVKAKSAHFQRVKLRKAA
jgi:hypothetical protein